MLPATAISIICRKASNDNSTYNRFAFMHTNLAHEATGDRKNHEQFSLQRIKIYLWMSTVCGRVIRFSTH
jgi:hypothetical protein